MKIVNLATVTVETTAGGTLLLTAEQAKAAASEGMECVVINPAADIVLVDPDGAGPFSSKIPGATAGTVANSPLTCPANVPTTVLHRSGPVRAIASASTVTKIAVGEAP